MKQFEVDIAEIRQDFLSLSQTDQQQSLTNFLPSILIDFDARSFYVTDFTEPMLNFDYLSTN